MQEKTTFAAGDKIVIKGKVSFWNLNNRIELEPGKDGVVSKSEKNSLVECTFQNPHGACQINPEKLAKFDSQEAQELIKSHPKDPTVLGREGYQLYKTNQLDQAIEKYKEALSINPNLALARSNLGHAYKKQGRYREAIKEWEDTIKRGPPGAIAIPIPRNIEDAKRLLYERENKNKDKDLPEAGRMVKAYIKELAQEKADWRNIYPKVVRVGNTAVPALVQALKSKNETLQVRAVDLLAKILGDDMHSSQETIEVLKNAYRIGSARLRCSIEYYIKDIDELAKSSTKTASGKKWYEFWK